MATHARSLSLAAAAGAVAVGAAAGNVAAAQPSPSGPSGGSGVRVVRLVADRPGRAALTDPKLVNAWGLATLPGSPLWVANNGTSTSTLYQGATMGSSVTKVPLDVAIPGGGDPTGMVANPTQDFVLQNGKTGPALFIFAGENGDISAWNRTGDPTKAVLVAHTRNAVYKGITMVTSGGRHFLLAADFRHGRIDVFDSQFHRVRSHGAFASKGIPRGYAPFDVSTLGGAVFVTYAKQDAARKDDVPGPGHGFLNAFSQDGRFLRSVVRRGPLDSPWGLAVAPRGFSRFAGDLLVGNFGNGRIHVVGRHSGRVIATLTTRHHKPVVIDGLWALLPGNGTAGGASDVWFSSGPDNEAHGLVGILR